MESTWWVISSRLCATAMTARWWRRRPRTPVLGAEVARRTGRAECCFDGRGSQPGAALRRPSVFAFAGALVVPGFSPAQEARWQLVANRLMSVPISAITTSAVRRYTPGIATSRLTAGSNDAIAASIRSLTAAIASSM